MIDTKQIVKEQGFEYVESGQPGTPLILLHGLMGALSNFGDLIDTFSDKINVVVPLLPIYRLPLKDLDLDGLVDHIDDFITFKGFDKVFLLGNSLGGHLCQLYALKKPEKIQGLILTGSSGLFENAMGNSFPKRGSKEYIRQKTEMVFYDPASATDELVDEVYEAVNDLGKCIRIVKTAKSAVRHNLEDKLHLIKAPTLLVWGIQDEVTPLWVGEKFHELIANSEFHALDKCGHVPMTEQPQIFNDLLSAFIEKHRK